MDFNFRNLSPFAELSKENAPKFHKSFQISADYVLPKVS